MVRGGGWRYRDGVGYGGLNFVEGGSSMRVRELRDRGWKSVVGFAEVVGEEEAVSAEDFVGALAWTLWC